MEVDSTESIPCGCVEVIKDEETSSIIFKIDKTLLSPDDEGSYDIGISLMDKYEA